MKVIHVCGSDSLGGASRAAYRIHRSLADERSARGVASSMRVLLKCTSDPMVRGGPPFSRGFLSSRLLPRLSQLPYRGFLPGRAEWHSAAWPDTGLGEEMNHADTDIVHLHWVGRFDQTDILSIEEIGRLHAPVVWTLHDQWAFCGAEHYAQIPEPGRSGLTPRSRYEVGYTPQSRPAGEQGPDLNRRTWLRKRKAWRQPMQIVCPSQWLADCVRSSALMRDWPVSLIANPVDPTVWAPIDQAQARSLLGLPLEIPLVVFGAMGGMADPRKGGDLLLAALAILHERLSTSSLQETELVVFGQSRPEKPTTLPFPIHYTGHMQDDISLRLVYAAADVFVLPSRQDNLPNTGLEAHACGTPIAAFRTGGLPDIVDDRVTGALAEPFQPESLAEAIHWVLEDRERRLHLSAAARRRAERLWNPAHVSSQYAELYARMLRS